MNKERKFKQSVAMFCTTEQYQKDLHDGLLQLTDLTLNAHISLMRVVYFDIDHNAVSWGEQSGRSWGKYHFIDHYDPELFLAIAAMSEDDFWPGEWVVINDRSIDELLIVHQSESSYLCVKRIEEKDEPGYFTVPKENFRKATVEELVAHFSKGSFPETPLIEFDPDDIDPKSIPKNSHYIDGKQMFFSQPMTENQIRDVMELVEKYKDPQPIGCSDSPIYQPDVLSTQDTGKIEITFNGIKYKEVKEGKFKLGDHVQGKFANGKYCLGTYIEESTIGSWHYVEDKHSKETHQCISVEPIPKITIELSALVRMYAEKIDADPDQIKIDFDK